jgi:hypothetical protein
VVRRKEKDNMIEKRIAYGTRGRSGNLKKKKMRR